MSHHETLKTIIPKGTLIRCLGEPKQRTIFSDSYSRTSISSKRPQSIALIEGDLIAYEASNNFILHGGKTKELIDFQVLTMAKKSICITILLEGKLDFSYDHLNFSLNADQEKRAFIVNLTRPVSFRRTLYKNNSVSKLNIILPISWLQNRMQGNKSINEFISGHLANLELNLNQVILDLTSEIITLGSPNSLVAQIKIEALTQCLLLEVFKQLEESIYQVKTQDKVDHVEMVEAFDPILNKLITYIEANLEHDLAVESLAKFSAMSASRLQHKFKESLGLSVRNYIRRRRLYIAKQQLEVGIVTITEAAYNAGYKHPSNFTIAFKKVFGFPPQDITIKLG